MIKSKFAISLHILTLLSDMQGEWLSSAFIAGSLNVNPVIVRKEIAQLKKAGLVQSKEGTQGGIQLLKDPKKILLSEIFAVAKGESHVFAFSKNMPNPACPIGRQMNEKLEGLFSEIDETLGNFLGKKSLEDFRKQF